MQNSVIADTLALVNVVRTAYGEEPLNDLPSSTPGHSSDCLYYRALSDIGVQAVSGGGDMRFASERVAAHVAELWGTTAHGNTVHSPVQFGSVIGSFDRGGLPQYSLNKTE